MVRFAADRLFLANDSTMVVTTGNSAMSVFMTMRGEAVSQPRWKSSRHYGPFRSHAFNPAEKKKRAFQSALRMALHDVGVTTMPLFLEKIKLKVTVTFYVVNKTKDIDNMLKFLMDAFQTIIYPNDNMVYEVVAKKVIINDQTEFVEFKTMNLE